MIEDLALISVVGGPHKELIGLSGKVLSILNKLEIRTSILSQGAQELNLIIGVPNNQYETVVKGIYEGMVNTDAEKNIEWHSIKFLKSDFMNSRQKNIYMNK